MEGLAPNSHIVINFNVTFQEEDKRVPLYMENPRNASKGRPLYIMKNGLKRKISIGLAIKTHCFTTSYRVLKEKVLNQMSH